MGEVFAYKMVRARRCSRLTCGSAGYTSARPVYFKSPNDLCSYPRAAWFLVENNAFLVFNYISTVQITLTVV